jgi:hypothetical protein
MGAAGPGRQGPLLLRDHGTKVTILQVKPPHRRSAFHDPSATAGREMTGRTGLTTGLGAIGEAPGPAASMIFGQAKNRPHDIKANLLATLGR